MAEEDITDKLEDKIRFTKNTDHVAVLDAQ